MMKIWIDDIRQPPDESGWFWCKSTNVAKVCIQAYENHEELSSIIIDLDHDAGDLAYDGGDYIKLLDWLEARGRVDGSYSFHIHSMNPVGVMNMRAIIEKNNWREIK